ncbi:hypothetical protein QE152_g1894 [Popillia japonica]|uniref:Reverse transcriptase n=1 Tax=Popillia japonica TaxID=7064 RepID=A0AAW1N113_POPJA
MAGNRIKGQRAAGQQGPEVIKVVVRSHPEACLAVMNKLLTTGRFPETWKVGRLVLIPKERAGRKVKQISVRVENDVICSQDSIKYLGVHFGKNMLIRVHIQKTAEKAGKVLANLCRLMPNVGGPRERRKRRGSAKLPYASLVRIAPPQRARYKLSHEVSAYRTASTSALQAIARMPPIDLLVEHRAAVESQGGHSKDREYRGIMAKWQARWDTENGTASWTRRLIKELQPWCARAHGESWTRRLIKELQPWCARAHGEVNFFLAQFLTGHGCFQSYLKRFGLESSDACLYCGREILSEKDSRHRRRDEM